MRKITVVPIVQFSGLVAVEAAASLAATKYFVMPWFDADFRGIAAVFGAILLFYLLAIAVFRLLQVVAPVPTGDIEPDSANITTAFLN